MNTILATTEPEPDTHSTSTIDSVNGPLPPPMKPPNNPPVEVAKSTAAEAGSDVPPDPNTVEDPSEGNDSDFGGGLNEG
jgi:hypothetical protein